MQWAHFKSEQCQHYQQAAISNRKNAECTSVYCFVNYLFIMLDAKERGAREGGNTERKETHKGRKDERNTRNIRLI